MPTSKTRRSGYNGVPYARHVLLETCLKDWICAGIRHGHTMICVDTYSESTKPEGQVHELIAYEAALDCLQALDDHDAGSAGELILAYVAPGGDTADALRTALAAMPTEARLAVRVIDGDYEAGLEDLTARASGGPHPLPFFASLDPFEFDLPMSLIQRMAALPCGEVLSSYRYRFSDLAMRRSTRALDARLDREYGTHDWVKLRGIADRAARRQASWELLTRQLGARFVTGIETRAHNDLLRYYLVHATNDPVSRDRIKRAVWEEIPAGSAGARTRGYPDRVILFESEPDLEPLKWSLLESIHGTVQYSALRAWLRAEIYLTEHLNQVLREFIDQEIIQAEGVGPRGGLSWAVFVFP